MKKMQRLSKPVSLLAVVSIASVGIIAPVNAGTDITTSPASWKLAQTSPSPTRRPATTPSPTPSPPATPSPTPSPATTTSPTRRPETLTNQNLCRRVVKPPQGLVIRREPSTKAPVVGQVAYRGRVTLTTNPPTTRRADGRDWVEISQPVRGWISHSLLTETTSNLAYCQ